MRNRDMGRGEDGLTFVDDEEGVVLVGEGDQGLEEGRGGVLVAA